VDEAMMRKLRQLFQAQVIGSLGTQDAGQPYVSMVPFAVIADEPAFVIHVSALAAHTRHMLADARVSLLVVMPPSPGVSPQATARVTIQGEAARMDESTPKHAQARKAYLERFPESAQTFELTDFALFAIHPRTIRFVGGFAEAKTITPEGLSKILQSGAE
jgi:putative heme iron utilization protein